MYIDDEKYETKFKLGTNIFSNAVQALMKSETITFKIFEKKIELVSISGMTNSVSVIHKDTTITEDGVLIFSQQNNETPLIEAKFKKSFIDNIIDKGNISTDLILKIKENFPLTLIYPLKHGEFSFIIAPMNNDFENNNITTNSSSLPAPPPLPDIMLEEDVREQEQKQRKRKKRRKTTIK
ncbi:MAG: hypothetical protein DRM99_04865 [Thermoplasmata archaeon]|nr:MAG: hypothetical protein DRM99_04865 [Thermoplasmata archaeon]